MEVTNTMAIDNFKHMSKHIIKNGPLLALTRTEVLPSIWRSSLSVRVDESPDCCVTKLKWKPSTHGGRTWAQPDPTSRQLMAVKAQAGIRRQGRTPGEDSNDLVSEIVIDKPLGPRPKEILRAMMGSVSIQLAATLEDKQDEHDLPVGGWAMLLRPGSNEPSGKIRLKLSNSEEVHTLRHKLQDCSIRVGGEHLAVQVNNFAILDHPNQRQGKGPGAARSSRAAVPLT